MQKKFTKELQREEDLKRKGIKRCKADLASGFRTLKAQL